MISNIADLKSRTLVESNTLKSFILAQGGGMRSPDREDILLHDYQIANSVTINTILSNYVVDLKYAWDLCEPSEASEQQSYFKIIEKQIEELDASELPDETRLILELDGEYGTFKSRRLEYDVQQVSSLDDTIRFINLDAVWYGVVRKKASTGKTYDMLKIADSSMNDPEINQNPFGQGVNLFDKALTDKDGSGLGNNVHSFNDFVRWKKSCINCIVENRFYRNDFGNGDDNVGAIMSKCRYLVCLDTGLYGLAPNVNDNREYVGFTLYDIGSSIPNINQTMYANGQFNFQEVGFHSIADVVTMFVVFKHGVKYHYMYFNEDTYDRTYGFTSLRSIVVDQMIVDPDDVFTRVEEMRDLDNVSIVMTDYGFWDIEPNTTNDITYSYRQKDAKTYEKGGVAEFNLNKTKLVKPTIALATSDKVVEYDKVWELVKKSGSSWDVDKTNGTHYKCRYVGQVQELCDGTNIESPNNSEYPIYLKQIVGTGRKTHDFVGGNLNFGVYDSSEGDPVHILPHMTLPQFTGILFSESNMVSPFIRWLYDKVVYHAPAEYGEYYLYNNHNAIAQKLNQLVKNKTFSGLSYQVVENDGLIASNGKFQSIPKLVESANSTYTSELYKYVQTLNELVNNAQAFTWLIPSEYVGVAEKQRYDFSKNIYKDKKEAFIKDVLDQLIDGTDGFPLLGYFRKYLESHFNSDFGSCPENGAITQVRQSGEGYAYQNTVEAVQKYIKQMLPATMVLADSNFSGIDSYIYQNRINLKKYDVQDIYSQTNTLKEVVLAVNSAPFFKTYNTYDEMAEAIADSSASATLFDMDYNQDFAALSNYTVNGNGDSKRINLSWNGLKSWLFPKARQSAENILKAFVRTQIYRPLFFKADNYVRFSSNESFYWCITQKYYKNHENQENVKLVLNGWPNGDAVNAAGSTLNGVAGKYTIEDIKYYRTSNLLEYNIKYEKIEVVNSKFVLDDIEYYVIYYDGKVNHVCFNRFQKEMQTAANSVIVENNAFVLKDRKYTIESAPNGGIRLKVEPIKSASSSDQSVFSGDLQAYKLEIVDDMFKVDGVWYLLKKDGRGKYAKIEYARVDDSILESVLIDTTKKVGHYDEWNLTFEFTDDWKKVGVIKKYQTIVSDRIKQEWCAFDDAKDIDNPTIPIQITENKTFDWYLSNEIVRMKNAYPELRAEMFRLGDGRVYSGQLDIDCKVRITHEIQGNDVISNAVFVKVVNGKEVSQTLGPLISRDLMVLYGRYVRGKWNSDGTTFSADYDNGNAAFILKDPMGGFNNCNALWFSQDAWENGVSLDSNAGVVEYDEGTGRYVGVWDESFSDVPEKLVIQPVYEHQSNGEVSATVVGYTIDTNADGSEQYTIGADGDYVHFIAKGRDTRTVYRYRANLSSGKVEKLVCTEIPARTIDFNTPYGAEQLRDNLLDNTKQYMMNEIVQKMVDSTSSRALTLELNPRIYMSDSPSNPALYLDLFSDTFSKENYMYVHEKDIGDESVLKFSEVYKNNIQELNERSMQNGNLYKYLSVKVTSAFGSKPSIVLVDAPSISVTKVVDGNQTNYKFSYDVTFDLHLMQNKELMAYLRDNAPGFDEGWVVGNATVKGIKCTVTFVPQFNSVRKSMTYSANYSIKGGDYGFEYDQIIYNYDGKTKWKSIDKVAGGTIHISQIDFPSSTLNDISVLPTELVSKHIQDDLIKDNHVKTLLLGINNHDINGSENNKIKIVDVQSWLNPKEFEGTWAKGNVWELAEDIPTNLPGRLLYINRGYTVVEGDKYSVSSENASTSTVVLKRVDGVRNAEYTIKKIVNSSGNHTWVIYDSANNEKRNVTKAAFNSFCNIQSLGDNKKYIEFKNNDYDPCEPIDPKSMSVNFDQVKGLENYVNDLKSQQKTDAQKNAIATYFADTKDYWVFPRHTAKKEGGAISAPTPYVLGDGLSADAFFEYTFTKNNMDTYVTTNSVTIPFNLSGEGNEQNDGGDDSQDGGWFGIVGGFSITFGNLDSSENQPYAGVIRANPCYSFTDLPYYISEQDSLICSSIVEYAPVANQELHFMENNTNEAVQQNTGTFRVEKVLISTESDEMEVFKVTFNIQVEVNNKWISIKPAASVQHVDHGFLISSGAVKRVFEILDFEDKPIKTLDEGHVVFPTNIIKYNETSRNWEINFDGESSEDFDLKSLYITLGRSGNFISISSDGYYVPALAEVIPPEESPQREGQIYDRYYQMEHKVKSEHRDFEFGGTGENAYTNVGKYWLDKVSTLKSISAESSSDAWKPLVYTPTSSSTQDSVIPVNLRDQMIRLKENMLKLDDDYFKQALTHAKTFLGLVKDELTSPIAVEDIRKLCNFGYSIKLTFKQHDTTKASWNETNGVFGYGTPDSEIKSVYDDCKETFNNHLYSQFFNDYSIYNITDSDINISTRDYSHILLTTGVKWGETTYPVDSVAGILGLRTVVIRDLHQLLNMPNTTTTDDLIDEIFAESNMDDAVRYMNAIRTTIMGHVTGMLVADQWCHLFSKTTLAINGTTQDSVRWYKFDSGEDHANVLLENRLLIGSEYQFDPTLVRTDAMLSDSDWVFTMLNRDLSLSDTHRISDAFAVHCDDDGRDLWYVSELGAYVCCRDGMRIVDMAYVQDTNSLYVLFQDQKDDGSWVSDGLVYRYDSIQSMKNSRGFVVLQKDLATMKIETFHSVSVPSEDASHKYIYVDYADPETWSICLYGNSNGITDMETWSGSPGMRDSHFRQYNTIVFGDSLFNESQLKFQNISKNKDMFDILDINEVDGCYYGLFKNNVNEADPTYTVFKTAPGVGADGKADDTGVVQRLPYEIVDPHMYRTADSLYSLYVVERVKDGVDENENPKYKIQLREISVPDSTLYVDRTIPLYDIMAKSDGLNIDHDLSVTELIMQQFRLSDSKTSFFALTNKGFHRVFYTNEFSNVSIDSLDQFKTALKDTLTSIVMGRHMDEKHHADQAYFFDAIARKINQFADDFSVFQLIPSEFGGTQEVGTIPDSKVDDTDDAIDHRGDSVQMSTDILWTEGMVAQTDTNPGVITAAVANPATMYDDDSVFTKSQRNPSIEGSEFYDYIYDQDGNALLDLYKIPFIYRVSSNATYDLYINIPTTRTKYLNRIAGTLKEDGTSQVLVDDTRTRLNFLDEMLPNNLEESTTRLRVYIDRKYVSVGNIELVEISGNSIPTQIYRDSVNDGLYDSIALESRWNGEVVELNDPEKDTNKVMLEFECYGTDSQSIHIQGKTLINRALDDKKYIFN